MISLILGKTKTNKTPYIKTKLKNINNKKIILDFKNEYEEIHGVRIDLGLVDPFIEPLSYRDAIAINSGAIEYSSILQNRSKEVLKDYTPTGMCWTSYKHQNLVEDALQRSINSWDKSENLNAAKISRHLTFKKAIQNKSLSYIIDKILNGGDTILLTSNGLHSTETRIILFLVLSRLTKEISKFTIISDNINNIWSDGYLFNFVKVFDFNKFDAIFSFNKTENAPKTLWEFTSKFVVFKLDSNLDFNSLRSYGLNVPSEVKRYKAGEYIKLNSPLLSTV